MGKKAHIGHWQIEDWKQPLVRVKDLLAKHKHEHTMGRTWRMLSRFQSRRNMKDEGIDDEDSDFCWIAQKDHGLLVEKAWAQI